MAYAHTPASGLSCDSQQRVPETVRQAVISVCHRAFHWKGDVRSIFLEAGVPEEIYDRHDIAENSKVAIARRVLYDLRQLGDARRVMIERKLVEELCRWDRPHRDAPDQEAGLAALADLKREATASQLLVDPERAKVQARRERAEHERWKIEQRKKRIGTVCERFNELSRDKHRTHAELQRRGYELERLLGDLFEAYEIEYQRPYRTQHEQLDGSFHFRGFTYIVESKWEKEPPSFGDIATFKAKVDGKLESVRGLFVAVAGFDDNVLDHMFKVARGTRNNLILMDRVDLITILEGRMALRDALTAKVDAAEQRGTWWYPLCR